MVVKHTLARATATILNSKKRRKITEKKNIKSKNKLKWEEIGQTTKLHTCTVVLHFWLLTQLFSLTHSRCMALSGAHFSWSMLICVILDNIHSLCVFSLAHNAHCISLDGGDNVKIKNRLKKKSVHAWAPKQGQNDTPFRMQCYEGLKSINNGKRPNRAEKKHTHTRNEIRLFEVACVWGKLYCILAADDLTIVVSVWYLAIWMWLAVSCQFTTTAPLSAMCFARFDVGLRCRRCRNCQNEIRNTTIKQKKPYHGLKCVANWS